MNDLLRQLISVAPAVGMGLGGNGGGAQAFMNAFNRTNQMLDEKERLQQHDQIALQDRRRGIERQDTADRYAAEDRTRQLEMQKLGLMPSLAELGATGETPEDAQRIIETAMPGLMNAFGQETMAYGMPAVDMASRTISARQKRQMREFVDKVVGTSFVADNQDTDPEITNLPEHVRRMVGGRPSAKLSELQTFAELPVGRPQKRPSEDVSWQADDVMVNGKLTRVLFNPKTREYKDQNGNAVVVDPVPPRQSGGDGGLTANQDALLTERLAKSWSDANASGREMRRQLGLMETGLRRFREGDKNGGSQAVLVTFQKILDPTSVVRESEYARSAQGISMLGRIQGYLERLEAGGAGVPDAELGAMVETARQMLDDMNEYSGGQRSRIEAVARKHQIDPVLIFGMEPARSAGASALPPMAPVSSHGRPTRLPSEQSAGSGGRLPAAQLRERRKFGDELREWNGSRWVLVTPTKQ